MRCLELMMLLAEGRNLAAFFCQFLRQDGIHCGVA